MRINKYVARATGMARRKVDSLIESGQITVNDKPARVGQQISESDTVQLAGKTLKIPDYTYLMLHKPVGYVCSRHSQKGMKTVYDLLPSNFRHLKLVGRLDKDSSGLILLTDDGDFAHTLLHPSQGKSKIYKVTLDKPILEHDIDQLAAGVTLEDGKSYLKVNEYNQDKLEVELTEGRNRQIRRTFTPLGYNVVRLHRITFGQFKLDDLESGQHKELDI